MILRKTLNCFFVLIILCTIFCDCKTTGYFSGTADLTIMIVDENGTGINDFNIVLSNFNNSEKGITNRNGICIFKNIPSGQYELSGKKTGYTKLDSTQINFIDKCDVFRIRVYSGNEILSTVENLFEMQNYEYGLELLDQLVCEKTSSLYSADCFYKAYSYAVMEKKGNMRKEIRRMKTSDVIPFTQYSLAVEQLFEKLKKEHFEENSKEQSEESSYDEDESFY